VSTFSLALSFGAAKERAFTSRRVYKKDVVNSVTTEILYLHDGMNAIVERNKTGTPTEYVYGPTGIIAIKTPSSMNYVIKDHLGSTRVMINTTEQPYALTTYDYSAFGTILTPPPSSAYLYTGQEWDQTSGLHNFKARMYDSDLAMFYGVDPAEQLASSYGYVGNNPLSYRDPDGRIPVPIIIGAIVGAYIGGSKANGTYDPTKWKFGEGKTWAYIGGGAVIGGAAGWAAGSVGGIVTGKVGLATKSGFWAATAGGAAGGAVGSAINYTGFYGLQVAAGDKNWNTGKFFSGLAKNTLIGGVSGGVLSGLSYGLSESFRFASHMKVSKYGIEAGLVEEAIEYVAVQHGYDPSRFYFDPDLISTEDLEIKAVTHFNGISSRTAIGPAALRDPSQLFSTVWHEGQHQVLFKEFPRHALSDAEVWENLVIESEALIYRKTFDQWFFRYLSKGAQDWIYEHNWIYRGFLQHGMRRWPNYLKLQ
jgi:RHS repeat-associated protein